MYIHDTLLKFIQTKQVFCSFRLKDLNPTLVTAVHLSGHVSSRQVPAIKILQHTVSRWTINLSHKCFYQKPDAKIWVGASSDQKSIIMTVYPDFRCHTIQILVYNEREREHKGTSLRAAQGGESANRTRGTWVKGGRS